MTSATLFREGSDLDTLLAEIDAEHAGQVSVVQVNHTREGGVFGFFARPRVAVEYTVDMDGTDPVAQEQAMTDEGVADEFTDPIDAMIAAAEMVETGHAHPLGTPDADRADLDDVDNVEFARMLLDMATRKAAERESEPPVVAAPDTARQPATVQTTKAGTTTAVKAATTTPAVEPAHEPTLGEPAAAPAAPRRATDARLALRRRLAELGVPFERIPADPEHHYAAIEQLVHKLPQVGPLPQSGDAIVVLAGPSGALAQATRLLVERMGLPPERVWTFGCPALSTADRRLVEATDAKALAQAVRRGKGAKSAKGATAAPPTLVVVSTDHADDGGQDDQPTAATVIDTLRPDACWLHVDATRKPTDTARQLAELGTPTALVVTGAAQTASPATVWELDVPVALLDGRPASASAWAVLMLEKLAEAAG